MRAAIALTVVLLAAAFGLLWLRWPGAPWFPPWLRREPASTTLAPEEVAKISQAVQMYLARWDPGTQSPTPGGQREFEREAWLAGVEQRYAMTDDLCQRFLHEGMSKTEVRALLGDPENSEYQEQQGNVDAYQLGTVEQFVMDAYFLEVHYDESQRLVSTEITQY